MDLFDTDAPHQILPRDGAADYHGAIMSVAEADGYFSALMGEIDWQHDRVKLYGKEIITAMRLSNILIRTAPKPRCLGQRHWPS